MQKWEYKIIAYGFKKNKTELIWLDIGVSDKSSDAVLKRLNLEGLAGWELAGVERLDDTDDFHHITEYMLKRPIE
jgi:hypothetical protein